MRRKPNTFEAEGHRGKGLKVGDSSPVWGRGLKAGVCKAQCKGECREAGQGGS